MHRNREFRIVGICGGRPELGRGEAAGAYQERVSALFAAERDIDADGLVIGYETLFKRLPALR